MVYIVLNGGPTGLGLAIWLQSCINMYIVVLNVF